MTAGTHRARFIVKHREPPSVDHTGPSLSRGAYISVNGGKNSERPGKSGEQGIGNAANASGVATQRSGAASEDLRKTALGTLGVILVVFLVLLGIESLL